jgi:hypothetical protein
MSYLFKRPDTMNVGHRTYHENLFLMGLKEFCAVFTGLICYSRIGIASPFYGGIILALVLIVFSFPFLNPYLFIMLRFGPFWRTDKVQSVNDRWNAFFRNCQQSFFIVGSQIAGSFFAAFVRTELDKTYNPEFLPSPPLNKTKQPDIHQIQTTQFFEEFFAVSFLLIGLINLIHALNPELINNTIWVAPTKSTSQQETPRLRTTPFNHNVDCCDSEIEVGMVQPEEADSLIPDETTTPVSAVPVITTQMFQAPVPLIFAAGCIVIALSISFPFAHQSAHITVYMYFYNVIPHDDNEYATRIGGGILGTAAGLFYYYYLFVWPQYSRFLRDHSAPIILFHSKMPTRMSSKREPISFRL